MTDQVDTVHCLDDELMAAFLEGRLDPTTQTTVERHVATCMQCLDVAGAALASDAAIAAPVAAHTRSHAHDDRRAATSRRVLGGAIAATVAFAAAALLAYAAAQWALASAARELGRRATIALAAPVAVGGLRIGIDPSTALATVTLDDVHVGRADGESSLGAVTLAMGVASLVRGTLDVRGVDIAGGTLHVGLPGANAGRAPRVDAGVLAALAAAATRGPVVIADVTLVLDRGGAAPTVYVDGVRGTVTPEASGVRAAIVGTTRGGGSFTLGGIAATSADGRVDLTAVVSGIDAAAANGAGAATARVDVTVHVGGTTSSPQVTTSVAPAP